MPATILTHPTRDETRQQATRLHDSEHTLVVCDSSPLGPFRAVTEAWYQEVMEFLRERMGSHV